ncbi:MAG: LicD family protein [Bacteroidales bacterium]|nr:LicD family protein [Bacteroidales bacterium]
MKKLLQNTHRQKNVDLLKARDYYFDIARKWNLLTSLCIFTPSIILAFTYLPFISSIEFIGGNRDMLIGIISVSSFIIIHLVCEKKITNNLIISNALREKYDCNVLEIPENPFAYHINDMNKHIEKCKYVKYYYKYEVWYKEIFCDNHGTNVLCSQLDNVIYTYYVYRAYKLHIILISIAILLISVSILVFFEIEVFVLVLISIFNIIEDYVKRYSNTNDLISRNKYLMTITKERHVEIKEQLKYGDLSINRYLQDMIISNRNQSIFLPKYIRNKYLAENSAFYNDLNVYKYLYLDEKTVTIPSCAEDIDIFNLNEDNTITLKDIQTRLFEMITNIQIAFKKHGIIYTLDGGTLIGAIRHRNPEKEIEQVFTTDGGFVFWDDDIDIAIPYIGNMLEKAKNAIREEFGREYYIQDYETDKYYSPRLSNFRIRDKRSVISEKDSPLYDLYKYRGLFIDVYSYTPILYNKIIDRFYRQCFIHPLYRGIRKTEELYATLRKPSNDREHNLLSRCLNKFIFQKEVYLKFVQWYLKHAHNDNYFVYVPNYIENLKIPGPYIRKEWLYDKERSAQFESLQMPIPSSPTDVLKAYYGKWYISPFKTIQMLKNMTEDKGEDKEKQWFSKNVFVVSVMKHISHVDLQK